MPIAIVMPPGEKYPAVLSNDDDQGLLASLREIAFAPPLRDVEAARTWLDTLAQPSGWFADYDEVHRHIDLWKKPAAGRA